MKKQPKSPIEPLKKLLRNASIFKNSNPKVFYAITKYCVEKMSAEMKKNPSLLNDTDKTSFQGVVTDMIMAKKNSGILI